MLFIPDNGLSEIRQNFNASKFASAGQLISKSDLLGRFGDPQDIEQILVPRIAEVCGKGVGKSYGENTLKDMIRKPDYDFLAVMNGDQMKAFIVVQKGECKVRPDWWAVKLICGLTLPGSGLFLLGAMLYAARIEAERLNMPDSKVVLELAGSYNNPAGFLTYSRLGFQKDLELYYPEKNCEDEDSKRCFCEEGTMPMSCELMRYSPDQFISFMLARQQSSNVLDDTGMLESLNKYPIRRLQNISSSDMSLLEAKQILCQKSAMKLLEYQKEARAKQEKAATKTDNAIRTGINKHTKDAVNCNLDFQKMYTDISTQAIASPAAPVAAIAAAPAVVAPVYQPTPRVLRSRTVGGAPVQRGRKSQQAAQASPYSRPSQSKSGTRMSGQKTRRMSGQKTRRMSGHKTRRK
jgi:hypothetical protein